MKEFDGEQLTKLMQDREVKNTEDLQALLRDLTKEVIETLYDGELTGHLGYEKQEQNGSTDGNHRNGKGKKKVKSQFG